MQSILFSFNLFLNSSVFKLFFKNSAVRFFIDSIISFSLILDFSEICFLYLENLLSYVSIAFKFSVWFFCLFKISRDFSRFVYLNSPEEFPLFNNFSNFSFALIFNSCIFKNKSDNVRYF